MSSQTSNQNQNKPMFHATFLDGIRGVAALSVVYAHSQTVYKQSLTFNTFNKVGTYGVIMFFVLSAFLLTLRVLLDWEQYHEKRKKKKDTDSVVNHLESGVDLEQNLSNVPLLSATDSDNITEISSLEEKPVNFFRYYIRQKIWLKYQIPIKFWLKFFLRRFMRVYPPYAIILLFIAFNGFVRKSYRKFMDSSTLIQHLFFQADYYYIFWTIPIELT
ncbi:22882_t:CDS:2, partial [Cetraspora pellucida]